MNSSIKAFLSLKFRAKPSPFAIKGKLTAKFRRENPNLNAFEEIAEFNAQIRTRQKALQKELAALEKALKERGISPTQKAEFKAKIAALKKEFAKLKEISPLNSQNIETSEPSPSLRGVITPKQSTKTSTAATMDCFEPSGSRNDG